MKSVIIGIFILILVNVVCGIFASLVPSISPNIYFPYQLWISAIIIMFLMLPQKSGFNL